MAKQTTITIEISSLVILPGQSLEVAWCAQCAAKAEMIALANMGVISNLDRRALEEWLNSGDLDLAQSPNGAPLICLNSLLKHVPRTKTT